MNTQWIIAAGLFGVCVGDALAFESYRPLGQAGASGILSSVEGYHPIKAADRVFLPGLRPPEAELLQQTLQQRYRRSLAKTPELLTRRAVPRIFADGPAFARARGIYAERWYANHNPQAGMVSSRNATQYDLYTRPLHQKPPVGIQIKSLSGGPTAYARAMESDSRGRFVIPDDHVEGLREHWRLLGEKHLASGRTSAAAESFRQRNRVKPLGSSMSNLEAEMKTGGRYLLREQSAQYVSYGAVAALILAPAIVDLATEGRISENGYRQVARGMALSSTAWGMNQLLANYRGGYLRGTLRGNVLTAAAILTVDTGMSIWQYGGTKAFSRPAFYENLGGGVGAMMLALVVGGNVAAYVTAAALPETGPWAPVIGGAAGLVAGTTAGIAGHIGGRSAARIALRIAAKDMLLQQDMKPIEEANAGIAKQIAALQITPATR